MASLTTSSFMTEILASAGHMEKDDLNAKLGQLCKRIDGVKGELYDSLRQEYAYFQPSLDSTLELKQRFTDTLQEMTAISTCIEKEIRNQLNVSTVEFQELSTQLEESSAVLTVLDCLVRIHDALKEIDSSLTNHDYSGATHHLEIVRLALEGAAQENTKEIHIFQVLGERYSVQKEQLVQDLHQTWNSHVAWHLPKPASKRSKKYTTELHISSSAGARNSLQNIAQAMQNVQVLESKLQSFSTRVMKDIVESVVLDKSVKLDVPANPNAAVLRLVHQGTEKPQPSTELDVVFSNIHMVFQMLNKWLLNITVTSSCEDQAQSVSLMHMMGQLIGGQFTEFITEKCLASAIPTNTKDLENFSAVISSTQTLEKYLKDIHFLPAEEAKLVDYVSNVNVHFANKKSQEILERAHKLMCSNLHNMVLVTSESPFGELAVMGVSKQPTSKEAKTAVNEMVANKACLSANTFQLPSSQISLSIQELCCLAYESLHEATTSTPQCAVQLFFSTHNIFELFCDVVPTFHKEALASLPQLAALHHNNCFYLAHHLMTLGHQFRAKLPPPLNQGMATFVDLVTKLRRLGTECFLQQMTRQRNQMSEYLAGAQGFQNVSDESNFLAAEKSLKQCLSQLDHLSHVWKGVLPNNIYLKAMGTLVNSVIMEVITGIVALEDIKSTDTHGLCSLLATLLDKTPEFFLVGEGDDEAAAKACILQHVPKWRRLQELQLLLDARLLDIADRWADGKGPLAVEFTANEVKQLIRALFQNSDRRANVLAKIK